ncbi:T9SS type B sorting domain-containing protein [Maribacter algarum]|uniref:T9SS type B sorting domain-containing protein n=1 Tax=Maribacter algarum (ex Zhang et al. 2020) TaxID=2578118 RepID=A0A5S3PIT3_9FLAO|nr:T9SS type B sorting domain-containing protein [Maribacter algarum]TMM53259.1 T9SS type B sorting domain-containing protein [Maribacter algarum]
MKKKLLFYLVLICSSISYGQLACPTLSSPMDGATNVPVDVTITWNGIVGAPGYLISIGTTPGGTDIVNERAVGNATSYQPPLGLPENTNIYVTITIFFFNAENIVCSTEMFRTEDVVQPPNCTTPRFPIDGSMNVNVATSIVWNYAPTATGYRISLGTTAGASDIVNNENIVGGLSYQPTMDLPVDTEIFVNLVPYNENGSAAACSEYNFTTGGLVTIPGCTTLVNPANGAINVELSPVLEWVEVPEATGYRVTIGTTPFNGNVLSNVNFTENSTLVVEFEPNLTFFITVVPFNSAGEALGCEQQSFSTILGCGPYFDSISNELIDLRPEINFPDVLSFCENDIPFMVSSEDTAEGFRWYKVDQFDNETLISSEREVALNETGRYRYEAFNTATQSGSTIECDISKIFEVVSSEVAVIVDLTVTGQNGTIDVSVKVSSGIGDYEFSVDNIDGPYQDSANFQSLEPGIHTFYVRDKNGCGITEKTLEQDLTLDGFPKFFTPNGDGINDFWQFIPPIDTGQLEIGVISIFNRYGMFLRQIDPTSRGWDGNLNGKPLPASDYWFETISPKNKRIQGHFSLKR